MPPPLAPVLRAYRAFLERQRALLGAGMVRAWDALDDYDEERIEQFAATVAPLTAGAKTATVAASTAFYAVMLDMTPPGVRAVDVPSVLAIRDPFTATWHALSMGRPYDEAVAVGRSTALASGETFIQSTARKSGDAFAASSGRRIRYQRVAEPGACSWCRTRDGGIYTSADAADYGHVRCNCDVVPVDAE